MVSSYGELVSKAKRVLEANRGNYGGREVVFPHREAYPAPFCWDTAFHVLALNRYSPELAKENIEALLQLQRGDGLIPNSPLKRYDMDLRSQPPLIVYAVSDYYSKAKDYDNIRKWFPKLIRYLTWWRDWGCVFKKVKLLSPFSGSRDTNCLAFKAICSTGMDNHPIYDFCEGKTFRIGSNHYVPVFDLVLSSTYAMALESLISLATEVGMSNALKGLREELEEIRRDFNEYLWSEEDSFYFPLTWQGDRVKVKSLQAALSLAAGIPDSGKAKKLVKVLEEEFLCDYGLLSVSKEDPKFLTPQPSWLKSEDPYYWRGTIWAPLIVLCFIGLVRYGYKDLAEEIAKRFLKAVSKSGFSEYFTPEGGAGASNLEGFSWTAAATIFLVREIGHY